MITNVALNMVEYYLFYWIFPILAMLFFGLFILFQFVLYPDSAKVLLKLRFSKSASLGLIADDDGIIRFELLEAKGQGTFKVINSKRRYFFLLRPLFKGDSNLEKVKDGATVTTTRPDEMGSEDRAAIDETLTKRHVLYDIKKPVFIGYTGKLILTGPATIDAIEKSSKLERTATDLGLDVDEVKKMVEKSKNAPIAYKDSYLNVLDPRVWKQYIKKTSNQPSIDALCYTHEQIGLEGKGGFSIDLKMLLIIGALILVGYFAAKMLKLI